MHFELHRQTSRRLNTYTVWAFTLLKQSGIWPASVFNRSSEWWKFARVWCLLIKRCNCHSQFKREGARARRELQRDWITSLTCRDVIMSGRVPWGSNFHHSHQQPAEYRRATSYLFPKLLYPSWTGVFIQQQEIKPQVLQHGGHKPPTGWRYFLQLMLVENPLSTHTKNTWN